LTSQRQWAPSQDPAMGALRLLERLLERLLD
jgi:hypothetical protein